ncbi:phosphoenolpyruvate--protein phosphotransferase [Oculatella sp. LEGE 06141]|uniref:phosphoenolpyruvate--protein phosphotransferase n=1 Tax=Oculatella sp. LEGE 06141 TaxID=1828648 RepID=UPI00187FC1CF|nr:phosphoenolpyruvate--protein phosphotransferase [Oculatella sp. LEGE 06141]MBE9181114.1 phosphoenolpyruvate--protein phosphotransferase [Oculatella sp. LEGE 06141]
MIHLGKDHIKLQANVTTKADAIRQAGLLLVNSGNMQSGYVDSMMEREAVSNTYLGNGIAIPHGLPKDRELIVQTGISVTQIPDGVEWNPGEQVYLVVGIAAKSDEHLEVLSNLTSVLDDEATIQRLAQTTNPQDIIDCLTRSPQPAQTGDSPSDFANYVDLAIQGGAGLHARPATVFVNIAKSFASDIRVRHGNAVANGKSLVSLLKLGVERGNSIRIMAQGTDADQALQALKTAVEQGLDEDDENQEGSASPMVPATPEFEGQAIRGVAASPGLAIGSVYRFRRAEIQVTQTADHPAAEEAQLKQAIATAQTQLKDVYSDVKERAGAGKAAIFQVHAEFLDDSDMLNEAIAYIQQGYSAGWAWQQTVKERAAALETLNDPLLAGRAADVRDVGRRVLRLLSGTANEEPSLPTYPVIVLAEDLTPSDTAGLDPAMVLGICTASGGPTSHTAIIARSLDLPAVVAAGQAVLDVQDGTESILDGDRGILYPAPTEADLTLARQAQQALKTARDVEQQARYQPAIMTDGHRIEVVANIGSAVEAAQAIDAGAEGVGLLRTEFLFLQRSEPPSEAEQFESYGQMVTALNGLPLIVRTLDVGGDKDIPYLNLPPESNPFLGIRGIRLCLAQPELFKTQLRAIFRAASGGGIKIMFPMIATLEELRSAKEITEQVRQELKAAPVEIGMMIEVPSVVMMAAEFAQEVDFFSIGTNDLTQYALAMDRMHPTLAKQADGLHPAVLRMIDQTVKAARSAGKWVGVCGGIAGDPLGATILAGLGVAELSVSTPSIATVKATIRRLSYAQAQSLARRALACRTAQEVRSL